MSTGQKLINYLRSCDWQMRMPSSGGSAWTATPMADGPVVTIPARGKGSAQDALAEVARIQGITTDELAARLDGPAGFDWNMSEDSPEEIVVEGIVMALEGCGDNETPVVITTLDGRQIKILGVTRKGRHVHLVVAP